MPAPDTIKELVDRFQRNYAEYSDARYKETQLRVEFVDPLFEALGWDVHNKQGYAERYKDVVHEDHVKVGKATKAPDYSFRVGGTRKFFVETKKPSVNLKDDISPAFQVRRYAWSAKLPLSILTDFEEFAVYDCRTRPNKNDKAATARITYFNYTEYIERWDEIAEVFSKEAVLQGSFDRYVEDVTGKRGTQEVDKAFLEELERWRELLAKNFAKRNAGIGVHELNFAVQRTIDRLIFLRIAEDRGLEAYERLRGIVGVENTYGELAKLFRAADDRYNSGLFHFKAEKDRPGQPDDFTLDLGLDDKVLGDIIPKLYYPDSPYEFSVLPADILGQVYEQFLGKVIRLTDGGRAKVEEKPEVRKAGGVYYTPTYIVDYIVEHTVGKLLEGKTRQQAAELRVLDPACGSGSFLLGAYQHLLDWHLELYVNNEPERHAKGRPPRLYRDETGEWRLTIEERKRILLDNIYGVDIDPQAVEVTKLSLLLKVLEGEQRQQAEMFQERVLPDLGDNIKCGNSLIGPDFYEGQQMALFDAEERRRINVFDWQTEFKDIMGAGGFDAVIGNPPYIRIQAMKEWAPTEVEFYKKAYVSASKGNYDIYVVFVEKGLTLLNKEGLLGFILPHKFFNAKYGEALRTIIANGKRLRKIVHFGDQQVFVGATTYTCLLFLSGPENDLFEYYDVPDLSEWSLNQSATSGELEADKVITNEWNFVVGDGAELFYKLEAMPVKLGDISSMFVGLQTSADTVFLFKEARKSGEEIISLYSKELGKSVEVEEAILKPVIRSGQIGRYWANPNALVIFPYQIRNNQFELVPESKLRTEFPYTWEYLQENKKLLSNRERGKFRDSGWYQLYPKNLDLWEQPKIMVPYMITRLAAYYDENESYFVNVTTGGFGITLNDNLQDFLYVTGLLNSKLLDWFLKKVSTNFNSGYFGANKQFLVQLPIHTISFDDPAEAIQHERMVSMVKDMLSLHKELAAALTPQQQSALQRQIEATDSQIDQLVYQLYGLSEDEIRIVEEAAA